ncbi:MAG TPA: nucleotidyl transferase AbiEii/AbiGii toxin family protein [Syntrophales bacterium]|nr:nucleotidyl transferase AbiEii/AbiGii toxin family protein [Syntrophales bacterium]
MNSAVARMLERYNPATGADTVRALREILQEFALLGLWRSKFFDKAAFYGGTALRILYGLDRFSEDLDFSLLRRSDGFDLSRYMDSLEKEVQSFGFEVSLTAREKSATTQIQSAFLKADTTKQLLVIQASEGIVREIPRGQVIKIKLEIDTDPPPGFSTENKYLLQPIPFPVRSFVLPDLFAGKIHAVLCRQWKSRVKGRDWYDLVWYIAHHPQLHLSHLQERMIQSRHLKKGETLSRKGFSELLDSAIEKLHIDQARKEVEPFAKDPEALAVWSKEFFRDIVKRIEIV